MRFKFIQLLSRHWDIKKRTRLLTVKYGLQNPSTRKYYYISAILLITTFSALCFIGQILTFLGALFTACFFLNFNRMRNTFREFQLKTAFEYGITNATANLEEFRIMVENTTAISVTIREIRLRKRPENQTPGILTRLQYRGPSYTVINNDPDMWNGDFFPLDLDFPIPVQAKMGMLKSGQTYEINFFPKPGDFHTLPPETGAVYALPFKVCNQFLTDDIHECLIIVEYPTILKFTKIISIKASQQSTALLQKSLRELVPTMSAQAKHMITNLDKQT